MEEENNKINNQTKDSSAIRKILMSRMDKKYEVLEYQKNQQSRTFKKKLEFVANLQRTHGNISAACELSGIKSRKTAYNWLEKDPELRSIVDELITIQNDEMNDVVLHLALVKHDGPTIRHYLDHNHPDYMKPKRITRPPYNH
ncbi:MAG: hypothetical protein K9L98_01780 [Candidatus Pacebacteria bacterium]|nr:hypothetical protein [Candidatus Paceibacterota bacterium]MCF7862717.1 hypothetical protein [Candidatus Paceibacterota bacterium]